MKTPFNVLRHVNQWEMAPRDPVTVGAYILAGLSGAGVSAVGAAVATAVFGTTAAYIVGFLATTAITSWALNALAPTIGGIGGSRGLLVNTTTPAAPHDIVYGTVRKGGIITYIEATGDENKFLHMIISMAGHEIDEFSAFYIDDELVDVIPPAGIVSVVIKKSEIWNNSNRFRMVSTYTIEIDVSLVAHAGGDSITQANLNYMIANATSVEQTTPILVFYDLAPSPLVVESITAKSSVGLVTSVTWNDKVRIKAYRGDQIAADPDLVAESALIGPEDNFVGNGIAYIYVRFEYDRDVFANGIPLITARIKGRKVYDPRTELTEYSANASLVVRDYLTADFGLADSSVDDAMFSASASVSDEDVALFEEGSQSRYEVNGVVSADMSPREIVSRMMTTCGGTLFWGQGKWQLQVGYYSPPVKTFTLDDLRGPITLDTRVGSRDNFNRVGGTFADRDSGYITVDFPPIESAAFKAEDNEIENTLDMQLPLTTSAAAAQRLAKMALFRAREQMTFSADFGLEAFSVQVGDIVAFTNPRYGWTEKEFEVVGWKFEASNEGGDLRVNLTLRETSEAAFAWNAEEKYIFHNNTTLPNFSTVSLPTDLTLTAQAPLNGDGSTAGSILVKWTASADAFVDFYEVQYKIAADADYSGSTTTLKSHKISPTISSTLYDVRVRGVSGIGVKSEWVEATVISARDEIAPAVPTVVLASSGYRQNIINWTNPSDLDLSFVQIYANTVNNSSTAGIVGTIKGTEFVHGGLPESTLRYYWLKSVDTSGNISGFSSVVSAATLADPQDGTDGVNGTDGTDGSKGDTVVTGRVFYQTLQASAPSKPNATSYSVATGTFSGLTSNWLLTEPPVDITDTSVQEWSSQFQVSIDGTTSAQIISFTQPSGAIQVTADIQSDNYIAGFAGWNIERDTGNAEFQNAIIRGTLNASDISVGTLNADRINIDGVTLDTVGGELIIKNSGVGTNQLAASGVITTTIAARAATDSTVSSVSSLTLSSSGSIALGSFTTTEPNQFIIIHARANAYGTGSGVSYSLALTIDGTATSIFLNSTSDSYATYDDLRFPVGALDRRVAISSGSHPIGLNYVIASGSTIELNNLDVVITLLKR